MAGPWFVFRNYQNLTINNFLIVLELIIVFCCWPGLQVH